MAKRGRPSRVSASPMARAPVQGPYAAASDNAGVVGLGHDGEQDRDDPLVVSQVAFTEDSRQRQRARPDGRKSFHRLVARRAQPVFEPCGFSVGRGLVDVPCLTKPGAVRPTMSRGEAGSLVADGFGAERRGTGRRAHRGSMQHTRGGAQQAERPDRAFVRVDAVRCHEHRGFRLDTQSPERHRQIQRGQSVPAGRRSGVFRLDDHSFEKGPERGRGSPEMAVCPCRHARPGRSGRRGRVSARPPPRAGENGRRARPSAPRNSRWRRGSPRREALRRFRSCCPSRLGLLDGISGEGPRDREDRECDQHDRDGGTVEYLRTAVREHQRLPERCLHRRADDASQYQRRGRYLGLVEEDADEPEQR